MRLAYKDLQLGSYMNIDPAECLPMAEMFRNAVACGSDVYNNNNNNNTLLKIDGYKVLIYLPANS